MALTVAPSFTTEQTMTNSNNPSAIKALTIRRFTEIYGISRAKTYRLIEAGELRAVKVGTRTLIPVDSAKSWFESLPEVCVAK